MLQSLVPQWISQLDDLVLSYLRSNWQTVQILHDHDDMVSSMVRTNERIISGGSGQDHWVCVYKRYDMQYQLESKFNVGGCVFAMFALTETTILIEPTWRNCLEEWDVLTGEMICTTPCPKRKESIHHLSRFARVAPNLVACCYYHDFFIWDIQSKSVVASMDGQLQSESSNGTCLYMEEKHVHQYEVSTRELRSWKCPEIGNARIHSYYSRHLADKNNLLVMQRTDDELHVVCCDVSTLRWSHLCTLHSFFYLECAMLADNQLFLSSETDGDIRVVPLTEAKFSEVEILRGHSEQVNAMVSIDPYHIATASSDGCVRIWENEAGRVRKIFCS